MNEARNALKIAVDAQKLSRRFGPVAALDGVSLQICEGEFFSLLGPSGCGKTTLLRLIAGLDFPDAGTLQILQKDAQNWPAHQRPVNTVFQSYALFPHLNVSENVAFGLRMKKIPPDEVSKRIRNVMELVQIPDLAKRKISEISGGQKQRVALARAIVNEPKILLLDEPLGALDLKLRRQLQSELHNLQRRLGITFIYVTHDQDEAITMSDRIAVMNRGRIEQLDTPQNLYERPRNRFVASFLGAANQIKATLSETDSNSDVYTSDLGAIIIPSANNAPRTVGKKYTFAIRPEKVSLVKSTIESESLNTFHGRIVDAIYSGAETQYVVTVNNTSLKVAVFNSAQHRSFASGDSVNVHLPLEAIVLLED